MAATATPTPEEQKLLVGGLNVFKLEDKDNPDTFYFRWRDVWDDNIRVHPAGHKPDNVEKTLRLVAFSLPAFRHDKNYLSTTNDASIVPAFFITLNEGESNSFMNYQVFEKAELAFW